MTDTLTPSGAITGRQDGQWAQMMRAIGLTPLHTGAPGGREVGQKVSHYIELSGAFARACAELITNGFDPLYVERWRNASLTPEQRAAAISALRQRQAAESAAVSKRIIDEAKGVAKARRMTKRNGR